jgi:hypothetical protein
MDHSAHLGSLEALQSVSFLAFGVVWCGHLCAPGWAGFAARTGV